MVLHIPSSQLAAGILSMIHDKDKHTLMECGALDLSHDCQGLEWPW